jgi:hypothetical protein
MCVCSSVRGYVLHLPVSDNLNSAHHSLGLLGLQTRGGVTAAIIEFRSLAWLCKGGQHPATIAEGFSKYFDFLKNINEGKPASLVYEECK